MLDNRQKAEDRLGDIFLFALNRRLACQLGLNASQLFYWPGLYRSCFVGQTPVQKGLLLSYIKFSKKTTHWTSQKL